MLSKTFRYAIAPLCLVSASWVTAADPVEAPTLTAAIAPQAAPTAALAEPNNTETSNAEPVGPPTDVPAPSAKATPQPAIAQAVPSPKGNGIGTSIQQALKVNKDPAIAAAEPFHGMWQTLLRDQGQVTGEFTLILDPHGDFALHLYQHGQFPTELFGRYAVRDGQLILNTRESKLILDVTSVDDNHVTATLGGVELALARDAHDPFRPNGKNAFFHAGYGYGACH